MTTKSLAAYVKGGDLQVSDQAMAEALMAAGDEASTGDGDGVEYVSFSGKSGAITYGRDREDLDEDEQFILEPRSAFMGWVCWVESKPVARHEWPVHAPEQAVPQHQLEDKGPYRRSQDGWQAQIGFGFLSEDGAVQYKFSTNSKSGRNSVSDLLKEIGRRMAAGEPHYPLFRFTKEKFQAQGEWNWKPKFAVDEWLDPSEVADMIGVEAAEAEEEVEEVQEEEAPKPRPRRTRRT